MKELAVCISAKWYRSFFPAVLRDDDLKFGKPAGQMVASAKTTEVMVEDTVGGVQVSTARRPIRETDGRGKLIVFVQR